MNETVGELYKNIKIRGYKLKNMKNENRSSYEKYDSIQK